MKKKLTLHRETLRNLSAPSLRNAFGGSIFEPTAYTYCLQCGTGAGSGGPEPSRQAECTIAVTNCGCNMD